MGNVFYKFTCAIASSALLLVVACSEEKPVGAIQIKLIRPTGTHCKYEIAETPVQTLESIVDMSGRLGRVVYSGQNVDSRPEILDNGEGFSPVKTQFARSGSSFTPLDENSLYAASLYYAVEQGYLTFASIDPAADVTKIVPNLVDTLIVHEARRTLDEQSGEVSGNAEYLPHYSESNPSALPKNYFFSYPVDALAEMPLGLNLGVMVHEFSHMVSHWLLYQPAYEKNLQVGDESATLNTLAALDEGFADYFGFLAVKDPGYFDCSYPDSGRDLSKPKYYTSKMASELANDSANFDSHELGAVVAAANYEIGQQIGHPQNARSLINLWKNLATCAGTGNNSVTVTPQVFARCHAQYSENSGVVTAVYQKYLGGR